MFLNTIFVLTLISICSSTIIITPPAKNGTQLDAALIFLQGASIPAKHYKNFATQLQQKFNGNLWIALTEFFENLPEPLAINSTVFNAFNDLQKYGLKLTPKTPVFFAGHSLGGAVLQSYLLKDKRYNTFPVYTAGMILEGSFVTRNHRESALSQSLPILTLGAELDGLCRITRMSESFYFNQNNNPKTPFNQITVVVKGMNHYQFSGEGNPPAFVQKHDLQPEISDETARDQITSIINSFMKISLNQASQQDVQLISNSIKETQELVQPIIEAFELEGFYHFKPPCYKTKVNCSQGSPWTEKYSQNILSGAQYNLNVADEFRIVYEPPEHLPKVLNTCTDPSSCVLNVTTVSQAVYSLEDELDNGLEPVAAEEIRTKLASRQAVLLAATGKKFDFNQTDGDSLCALINKESLNLALKKAPAATVKRYLNSGIQLVPGSDIGPLGAGPLWIWDPLSLKEEIDPNTQKPFIALRSPMMKYPVDYSIKAVAGIHYCKILSPARALEWFYVDSLKPRKKSLLSHLFE